MNDIIHSDKDSTIGRMADELADGFETVRNLTRRRFLAKGSASLGGAFLGSFSTMFGDGRAYADKAVKTGQFIFPRLQFSVYDNTPDIWNAGPIGDVHLRQQLHELTNINVCTDLKVVRLDDFDDMVKHPFVFMTSEGYFRLKPQEERNLREFLERGGFILADDCVYTHSRAREDRFFRTYKAMLDRLFPDNPMRKIPYDHEIFHIYYDFKDGCPHMQGVPHGAYATFERGTGRIMTINCPGDIHCGWINRFWDPAKNMEAIRMGINIVIYFLSH